MFTPNVDWDKSRLQESWYSQSTSRGGLKVDSIEIIMLLWKLKAYITKQTLTVWTIGELLYYLSMLAICTQLAAYYSPGLST